MKPEISSLQNPTVRLIQRLIEKSRDRRKQGLFIAEGRREVSLALGNGYLTEKLLICPEIFKQDKHYPVTVGDSNNERILYVSPQVYNRLAYRKDSEGVILVGHIPDHSLKKISCEGNPLIVVLENVEKPGNLGAILRTCDAAGVDSIILCDTATDLYNPNIIRSSLGCLFTQHIALSSSDEVLEWLKSNHISTFAAHPESSAEYSQVDYKEPSALVFGSESLGLSEKFLNGINKKVSIPMAGKIDSLNVSVSAAIIIFEAVRQRKSGL